LGSVYEVWREHQTADIAREDSQAVVPDLIMKAYKLPEDLRPSIERVWDEALRTAIRYTEHVAQHMGERGSVTMMKWKAGQATA
jgi:hypothetical protein